MAMAIPPPASWRDLHHPARLRWSFFKSTQANDRLGFICGILTMTPYNTGACVIRFTTRRIQPGQAKHRQHSDPDGQRVSGLSRWGKLSYRAYRHPMTLFGVGAFVNFVVFQRFTFTDFAKRNGQACTGRI
jgi:omega-6 fatty acid desaturase (delta-12 desaturase)